MTRDQVLELTGGDEVFFLEGPEFDRAIVGVVERFGGVVAVCYDFGKVLKVLRKQGMDPDEAQEWFDFNVIGSYLGDATPVYLRR